MIRFPFPFPLPSLPFVSSAAAAAAPVFSRATGLALIDLARRTLIGDGKKGGGGKKNKRRKKQGSLRLPLLSARKLDDLARALLVCKIATSLDLENSRFRRKGASYLDRYVNPYFFLRAFNQILLHVL